MNAHEKEQEDIEIESDPLLGAQETTDSRLEARATPDREMVLETPPQGAAVKSKKAAGFLGVFFGGLGLHRFYLGYQRVGTVQFILTVGAFVIAFIAARLTGSTMQGSFGVALGAAALGILWGLFEGFAIFVGGLTKDAAGRPLHS